MHSNRRAYPRYSLQHDAIIVAKGFSPASSDVINVCAGGMCLAEIDSQKLASHLAESPGEPVEIHLFSRGAGAEQHFAVLATVCRSVNGNIGVQFHEPQSELVQQLLQENTTPVARQVVYTTQSKREKLQNWFAINAREFVVSLWNEVLQHASGQLEQGLRNAIELPKVNDLKLVSGLLQKQPEVIREACLQLWDQQLTVLSQAPVTGRRRTMKADLKVVEKGQFEDWLELQMILTGIAKQRRAELFLLDQFLSQVYGRDVDDRDNPVAPVALGQALHGALEKAEIPESVRGVFYQSFEKALAGDYSHKLNELINIFSSHGLHALPLESIRTHWSTRPVEAGRADAHLNEAPETSGHSGPENGRRVGNVLQLVKLHRDLGNKAGRPDFVDSQGAPTEKLASLLQNLQPELLKKLSAADQSLASALLSNDDLGRREGLSIPEDDWEVVELVDKIFAPVQSRSIPQELLGVINQLRIPLLNLLLKDQSFLENQQHPARQVLNHFMSLVSADRVSSKNLEKLLSQVVDELAEAGEISPALLNTVANRLEELVKRQEKAFNRNAERIAKAYQGKQLLQDARRAIARRINALIGGHRVPQVLLDLLEAGWEQAMVLAYLKEGGDSDTVTDYYTTLEQIFHWLDPSAESDGLSFERELESAALLDLVEKELAMSPEAGKARAVIRDLRHIFVDETEPRYVDVPQYPLEPIEEEEPGLQPGILEKVDERWQERAHQLKLGDWLEMKLPDQSVQRMRLVWVGENAFKFVFLTPQGLHEIHYDYVELIRAFQDGRILRSDAGDIPFVDHSLYGIVEDLYQKMAFQAVHDPLTGCANRHEIEKQITATLNRIKVNRFSAALLVMDVDRFDLINSTYGNPAGDALLREFSLELDVWMQEDDLELKLGRTGGNEFTLLMEPCSRETAQDIAERLRRRFSTQRFEHDGQAFHATLSIGVVFIDEHSDSAGELLNAGSRCCKDAKRNGGDQVRLYSSDDSRHVREREIMQWITRLDEHLENGQLFLRAQKIRASDAGVLPMYEILLGVLDEQGQPTSPEPYVVAAEKYNKSTVIDTWVVREILKWMRGNPKKLEQLGGFTVNLSGQSLSDNRFMEYLEQQFRQGGFPAHKLCFEITETAAVVNLNYAADFMLEMKRRGCSFALDDFGTGFSSYAYLQKLPVDYLKIDGVFVRDMHDNMTSYAMVKSIAELSRFLGMKTIAECVENKAVLDALDEISVEFVQGYHIEKPGLLSEI